MNQAQTNKYLFHANKLLAMASELSDSKDDKAADSLILSAELCAEQALTSWVNELVGYISQTPGTFDSLAALLQSEFIDNPDVQHLNNLKLQPDTWLGQLLKIVALRDEPVKPAGGVSKSADLGLIKLVAVEQKDEFGQLKNILSEFKQYISIVRSQHVEW